MNQLPAPSNGSIPSGFPQPSFHWRRYLLFVRKWWWIPTVTALIGVGIQILQVSREPELFSSFARMWVSGKLQIPEGRLYQEEVQNFFGTQIALMQSGRVMDRAHALARASKADRQEMPVDLQISVLPRTSILLLQASGTDADYLQRFLHGLMDEYLKVKRQFRAQTTDEALAAVNQEYTSRQRELDAEQEKLEKFKKENDVVVLQAQGNHAGSYLAQLHTRRSDAGLELQAMEMVALNTNVDSQLQATRAASDSTNGVAPLPNAGTTSKSVQDFFAARSTLQNLKLQLEELSVNLKPKHPKIIQLNNEIAKFEKMMDFYRRQSQDDVAAARNRLLSQLRGLDTAIDEWEGKAVQANVRLAEYDKLRANVTRLQGICDRLYETVQKVDLDRGFSQETLTQLEDASMGMPTPKPWQKRVLVGAFLGILAGAALVYLVERMDDRVVPSTNLAHEFDINILGRVPNVKLIHSPDKAKALPKARDRQLFTESYRNLRSSLLFMPMAGEQRPKTIIVTSAVPYEGKSTVTVNLAETLAHAGCRVLLIDGDMRRGQLQKFFQLPSEPGLSDLLTGQMGVKEVVHQTPYENLFFVPTGKPTEVPGELFLNGRTDVVLRDLAANYDFVLIDTPPILATDDTTSLAPKTDGVLFVVRESFSKSCLVRPALDQLLQRQAKVLGLIVNRANSSANGYCYYKYAEYYGTK
jgi:capsular exopolysaccharide synthesis family protein